MAHATDAPDITDLAQKLSRELLPHLSPSSSISPITPPRWSDYNNPHYSAVVNIATEHDVAHTVRFCAHHCIPFLAQAGGSNWSSTINLRNHGVVINLSGLNTVAISDDQRSMTIGGGLTVKQTIAAAADAGVLVMTGNCNCVGTLGAYLGGGYGYLMGRYDFGFGIDNMLSMRVVTASGDLITASPCENADYFWTMRGAGQNFGIVTSAVVKAVRVPADSDARLAFGGSLIFSAEHLEALVAAVEAFEQGPGKSVYMFFFSSGAPAHAPVVIINAFMHTPDAAVGRAAFARFYEIGGGPMVDATGVVPYTEWNTGGDVFCVAGGRKPVFSVGMNRLDAGDWRRVWDLFVEFQGRPGAEGSGVLLETYPIASANKNWKREGAADAAFPWRDVRYNALVVPWYSDAALDEAALEFGRKVRDIWRANDGLERRATYANFAHGDEDLETVFGEGLPRLRELKRRLDPENRFGQSFDLLS